jgi:apolipoprotein D and lipocalin family protein
MPRLIPSAVLAAGLMAATAVWAGAPPIPVTVSQAPMDTERLMGRWYEILRTPNKLQSNCFAAYQVWSRKGDAYAIQQVCHRDKPEGRVAAVTGDAKPLNPQHTLFDASFLGGFLHAKFVLADHADDYSWLITTTADGRYPKLLARAPGLPEAEQQELKQRMAEMGFDVHRLEPCGQTTPAG